MVKSVALAIDGLFALQIEGIVGVGHQALLVGLHGLGEGLEVSLGEAAVTQGTQGQDALQQGVHLGDGVLGLAAQDAGNQLLETHDLAVGVLLIIVVHDGAEQHVVGLAVRHMIGAAQGEAHAVDRAAAGLQEGDAGIEGSGDELIHVLEPGVLAFLVDELEALQNHVHGLFAE